MPIRLNTRMYTLIIITLVARHQGENGRRCQCYKKRTKIEEYDFTFKCEIKAGFIVLIRQEVSGMQQAVVVRSSFPQMFQFVVRRFDVSKLTDYRLFDNLFFCLHYKFG